MKASEMKKGMHIIISNDISKTSRTHTANNSMRKMQGQYYTIKRVIITGHGLAAIVNGWTWHPEDLTEVEITKKSQIFHFDIKELEI